MQIKIKSPKQLGLVLGGGAMRGAAIFGVMEELEKSGLTFTHVAGTSAGAIIGAFYALNGETWSFKEELEAFTKKDWLKFVDMNHLFGRSLIKGEHYRAYLKKRFGDATFRDTRIPLIVSATNLTKGKVEYINKGKIVDALMATSAFPGLFPPVETEHGLYVDGCVLDNLPHEPLLAQKIHKIIAINLSEHMKRTDFNSVFDIIGASIDLMVENALKGRHNRDKRVFMFSPKLKQSPLATWNIADLHDKFMAGKREFQSKKNELAHWLRS